MLTSSKPSEPRKIIHVDMDCFYAAIEERDNPILRGKPLAVGGLANRRGVLCTCNYPARKFGIHSGMPTAKALQLCPDLVIKSPNISYYKTISYQIKIIFNEYSAFVEPLSLDEAFLDVTDSKQCGGSATLIAEAIRKKIIERHGLTASAGVAPNKFLAKIASDWNKPNGLFVIQPKEIDAFIQSLPIEKIFGVGKVTAQKIHQMGIQTCGDLQQLSLSRLLQAFGAFGATLYHLARGEDHRAVEFQRESKSVSVEKTFAIDIIDHQICLQKIQELFLKLQDRLKKHQNRSFHKPFIKIKFKDFTTTTKEKIGAEFSLNTFQELFINASKRKNQPIRLLGVGIKFDESCNAQQGSFNF